MSGSGCRPFVPVFGPDRSRSRCAYAAPGMCPAFHSRSPHATSSSLKRQSTTTKFGSARRAASASVEISVLNAMKVALQSDYSFTSDGEADRSAPWRVRRRAASAGAGRRARCLRCGRGRGVPATEAGIEALRAPFRRELARRLQARPLAAGLPETTPRTTAGTTNRARSRRRSRRLRRVPAARRH